MLLGFITTAIYIFILCGNYKKGVILVGTTIQLLSNDILSVRKI
jgi:hypothetical protein